MKHLNCKCRYGHLYNIETGKRIILKEGSLINLLGEFEHISYLTIDLPELKTAKQQKEIALMSNKNYRLLLAKGEFVYFHLNCDKLNNEFYYFKAILHEDLWVLRTVTGKNKKGYHFSDCVCETIENTSNNIEFYENLIGYSLNDLYRRNSIIYLGAENAANARVSSTFFIDPYMKISLGDYSDPIVIKVS